jgi:hypothetical protein
LEDTLTEAPLPFAGEVEFPFILKVQDAKANILKMKLQA